MLENYEVFFIGCVGAIAPEILRLYRLRDSLRFNWSWSYILISVFFVLLGGFVSSILEPSNNYAAFYSGVGTPFIINAITKETQQVTTPQEIPVVTKVSEESEVTRIDKGITSKGSSQRELETLNQATSAQKKMGLKEFFRAL